MTPRDVKLCLFDVRQAGERIRELTDDCDFAQYESDWVMRSAAERQFEIIGEALNRTLRIDASVVDRIAEARKIIAFRNRVVHGYDAISNAVVWGIIRDYLPRLLADVDALLAEYGAE